MKKSFSGGKERLSLSLKSLSHLLAAASESSG